jgi:hypothetical protein
MAKIENNVFLYGVSGKIGNQLVIRQTARGGVISVAPRSSEGELSPAQEAQREKFRLAVAYGKGAKGLPEYASLAASKKISTFNVATADFLHPPEIIEIDLSSYNGHQGEPIQVRAVDDVAVTRVGILVLAQDGTVVEEGLMAQANNDKTRWTYVATSNSPTPHVQIIVDATDLASQVTRKTEDKTV